MKIRIVFLLLCFTLGLNYVNAQNLPFANEIEGLQFSKDPRIAGKLKLLVSTRADVIAAFGEHCVDQCDFNSDWKIQFGYVYSGWTSGTNENGVKNLTNPRAEFVDKLHSVELVPKREIIFSEKTTIPSCLQTSRGTGKNGNVDFKFIGYTGNTDSVSYIVIVYDEAWKNSDGKTFKKNQLGRISYGTPSKAQLSMFTPPASVNR